MLVALPAAVDSARQVKSLEPPALRQDEYHFMTYQQTVFVLKTLFMTRIPLLQQERWFDPDYLYLSPHVSHSGQAKPHSTAGDSSHKLRSDSEQSADDSWVDVGKQTQAAAAIKEPLNQPKRWFPFSEGPRSCVGQTLANMNVTGTLATLLAHYHFRLADRVLAVMWDLIESVAIRVACFTPDLLMTFYWCGGLIECLPENETMSFTKH